jgi:hypothetical protein
LRSDVIDRCSHAAFPRAVSTAEECALGLDPVTDDLAAAVIADRRQFVDSTFETIERMGVSSRNDLKRQVVIVAADFTSSHMTSCPGAAPRDPPPFNSGVGAPESPA